MTAGSTVDVVVIGGGAVGCGWRQQGYLFIAAPEPNRAGGASKP